MDDRPAYVREITETVTIPAGPWYRDKTGWRRDEKTIRVTAEIFVSEGGLRSLVQRAAKSKGGRASAGPLRVEIVDRTPAEEQAV